MLLHGVAHVLVHRQEDLFMAPVELLLVVSAGKNTWSSIRTWWSSSGIGREKNGWRHLREGVDHGGDGRLLSGANVVKVHHALHGPGLHAPHDGLGVFAEEGCRLGCGEEKRNSCLTHTDRHTVTVFLNFTGISNKFCWLGKNSF